MGAVAGHFIKEETKTFTVLSFEDSRFRNKKALQLIICKASKLSG